MLENSPPAQLLNASPQTKEAICKRNTSFHTATCSEPKNERPNAGSVESLQRKGRIVRVFLTLNITLEGSSSL